MDFKEIIQKSYKLCKIFNISAENKLKIADQKKIAIENFVDEKSRPNPKKLRVRRGWTEELRLKHMRWSDLRTTAKIISRHIGNANFKDSQFGTAAHIHELAYGKEYDIYVPESFHTVTTFKKELCDECKKLENVYEGNDSEFWEETDPWEKQYYKILQSLLSDSYKAYCGFKYFAEELKKIEHTLKGNASTGVHWKDIIILYKVGVEASRMTFLQGKRCFFQVEQSTYNQFNKIDKKDREKSMIKVAEKYLIADEDALKCIGGAYVLNRSKLCSECAKNIEKDPIKVGEYDKM